MKKSTNPSPSHTSRALYTPRIRRLQGMVLKCKIYICTPFRLCRTNRLSKHSTTRSTTHRVVADHLNSPLPRCAAASNVHHLLHTPAERRLVYKVSTKCGIWCTYTACISSLKCLYRALSSWNKNRRGKKHTTNTPEASHKKVIMIWLFWWWFLMKKTAFPWINARNLRCFGFFYMKSIWDDCGSMRIYIVCGCYGWVNTSTQSLGFEAEIAEQKTHKKFNYLTV